MINEVERGRETVNEDGRIREDKQIKQILSASSQIQYQSNTEMDTATKRLPFVRATLGPKCVQRTGHPART
jgi:copper chaperone CopZ